MERRALLGGMAALVSSGAIAGCLRGSGATPSETTTTPPEATVIDTVDVGDQAAVAFPANNEPHVVFTVNRSDIERTIELVVDRAGTTVYDRVDHLEPNEAVKIRLVEPASYTVRVRVGSTPGATIEVPRDRFDCNHSTTHATVVDGGVVKTKSMSTLKGCPEADVTGSSIELTDRRCTSAEQDTASVTVADETVEITGSLIAPNPCHRVGLASVTLTDGTLRVVVEERDADRMNCIQCIAALEYTATVNMANAYPDRIVVVHADDEGETVVTTVDR